MKPTIKRLASAKASKVWKAIGKKNRKRTRNGNSNNRALAQQAGSGSRSRSRSPVNRYRYTMRAGSSAVSLPIPEGLCRFCRFRPHNNNNGKDNNDPQAQLLVDFDKVELFKKYMKDFGYLGKGEDFDEDDYKCCEACGRVMDYVLDLHKEIARALRGVLDNAREENVNVERDDGEEMAAIVIKEEDLDIMDEEFDDDLTAQDFSTSTEKGQSSVSPATVIDPHQKTSVAVEDTKVSAMVSAPLKTRVKVKMVPPKVPPTLIVKVTPQTSVESPPGRSSATPTSKQTSNGKRNKAQRPQQLSQREWDADARNGQDAGLGRTNTNTMNSRPCKIPGVIQKTFSAASTNQLAPGYAWNQGVKVQNYPKLSFGYVPKKFSFRVNAASLNCSSVDSALSNLKATFSTQVEQPFNRERHIQGKEAVCKNCGTFSSDLHFCEFCKKRLPETIFVMDKRKDL